jgi:hypothetical protein
MPTPTYGLRYPSGSDAPDGPQQIQDLAEDVEDTLGDGHAAWISWSPIWTATDVNPVLGDGSRYGRYCKIGRTVHFSGKVLFGSTTSYGTGFYSMSLPDGLPTSALGTTLCHAYYFDADGATEAAKHYVGVGNIAASNSVIDRFRFVGDINGLPWSPTAPVVPEAEDYIVFSGTYETSVA